MNRQAIHDEIAKRTYDVKFVEHGMDLRDGEEIADIVLPIVERVLAEQREAIATAIESWKMTSLDAAMAIGIARNFGKYSQ